MVAVPQSTTMPLSCIELCTYKILPYERPVRKKKLGFVLTKKTKKEPYDL